MALGEEDAADDVAEEKSKEVGREDAVADGGEGAAVEAVDVEDGEAVLNVEFKDGGGKNINNNKKDKDETRDNKEKKEPNKVSAGGPKVNWDAISWARRSLNRRRWPTWAAIAMATTATTRPEGQLGRDIWLAAGARIGGGGLPGR